MLAVRRTISTQAGCPRLRQQDLTAQRLPLPSSSFIVPRCTQCPQLEVLEIGSSGAVGAFGGMDLARALAASPRLRELRLTVAFTPALRAPTLQKARG